MSIPKDTKLSVFFRDGWMCQYCGRPTVFHFALRRAEHFVGGHLPAVPLAYYHRNWKHDLAPLLDELGAEISRLNPEVGSDPDDPANLVTACAPCSSKKTGTASRADLLDENERRPAKAKRSEPEHWDGLTALFVAFARDARTDLTDTEDAWLVALEPHFSSSTTTQRESSDA